jgi:hypothetical protein
VRGCNRRSTDSTSATHALTKIVATTKYPAPFSAWNERSTNATPSGTAVSASPKLWIRSASSATLLVSANTTACAEAVTRSTTRLSDTARRPAFERLIEALTSPWLCLCPPSCTCALMRCVGRETEPEMLGVGDRFGQQHADVVVVELVDRLPAVTLTHDESEVPQHAKLLGDRRLLHLDIAGELRDRTRPGAKAAEDPHPARSRERLHRLGDDPRRVSAQVGEVDIVAMARVHIIAYTHAHPCMIR